MSKNFLFMFCYYYNYECLDWNNFSLSRYNLNIRYFRISKNSWINMHVKYPLRRIQSWFIWVKTLILDLVNYIKIKQCTSSNSLRFLFFPRSSLGDNWSISNDSNKLHGFMHWQHPYLQNSLKKISK